MCNKPKYSNTRMMLEYALIFFICYFFFSGGVSIIFNVGYRTVLTSDYQVWAIILLYWWIPVFRIVDIVNENERIT